MHCVSTMMKKMFTAITFIVRITDYTDYWISQIFFADFADWADSTDFPDFTDFTDQRPCSSVVEVRLPPLNIDPACSRQATINDF